MTDVTHVVILAGGKGERFWPWSRARRPKPLLPLVAGKTLLGATWSRARRIAPASRIWVVAPSELRAGIRKALPRLPASRLLIEPSPKDTAPAIALACARIASLDPKASVLVLPSDHAIDDDAAWARDARRALREARSGALVCLGVPPHGPSSAFGYLLLETRPGRRAARVVRFVEKPAAAKARALIRTGRCLWNAGMFAWRVDAFLAELRRQNEAIAQAVERRTAWSRLAPISVDYAVLEGAQRVRAVPLSTGWDDLGSWDAAARRAESDLRQDVLLDGSPRTVVFPDRRFVAVIGIPDAVVVDTPDVVLVLARSKSQDVRRAVRSLPGRGRRDLV